MGQARVVLWWVLLNGFPLGKLLDQFTLRPVAVKVLVLHVLTNSVFHLFRFSHSRGGVSSGLILWFEFAFPV